MPQTLLSFESYLAANRNTRKPVLHISLNPSPEDRLSDEQFAFLAKDYMEKMNYGDQPYIVYVHEDIDRRHIHIVSICVDETGRKIIEQLRTPPFDDRLPRTGNQIRAEKYCRRTKGIR
jgi:hypothetical protein